MADAAHGHECVAAIGCFSLLLNMMLVVDARFGAVKPPTNELLRVSLTKYCSKCINHVYQSQSASESQIEAYYRAPWHA